MRSEKPLNYVMICLSSIAGIISNESPVSAFSFTSHSTTGQVYAEVPGGSPPYSPRNDSESTTDPLDNSIEVEVVAKRSEVAQAAAYTSSSQTHITSCTNSLYINSLVHAQYAPPPVFRPDLPNPGGSGTATLNQTVEFLLPADTLDWMYKLNFSTTPLATSASVTVLNITHGTTLLTLTSDTPHTETTISGNMGDLIRITVEMSTGGVAPDGADNSYSGTAELQMRFGNDPPSAACQDIAKDLDKYCLAYINAQDVDNGSTTGSNCESYLHLEIQKYGDSAFNEAIFFDDTEVGENTVILRVTQTDGLTDECTATVTINPPNNPDVVYVDANVSGGMKDGTSWSNAFSELQSALDSLTGCSKGAEIWIAQGIYKPDQGVKQTPGDRQSSFRLINGTHIYGGFPTGGGEGTFDARHSSVYQTVLSGDIGTIDDNSDNCYHVVTAPWMNTTAILDGVIITDGNANGPAFSGNSGGGLFNDLGMLTLINCKLVGNSAIYGGAIYNYYSNITLINCLFDANSASNYGGGMYSNNSNTILTNCTVSNNSATSNGGGIYIDDNSDVTMTNSILWGNSDSTGNSEQAQISTNHAIMKNYCCIQNFTSGGSNNTSDNPLFADPDGYDNLPATWQDNNYRPGIDSLCIDSGNNTAPQLSGITTDLDYKPRFHNTIIDRGAYEFNPTSSADFDHDYDVDLYDYGHFNDCASGPAIPLTAGCEAKDFDNDNDVDQNDFALFQKCFSGFNYPADPGCPE